MERMREVLNEFMRFMNPHLLSARLYLNSYFPRFLRIEQIFSHERGKRRIFDRVRNVTNLWRFALIVSLFGEGKDHSLKSRG